jgi:heme/copper-type cytochrome/quinol oxidase subunit 3
MAACVTLLFHRQTPAERRECLLFRGSLADHAACRIGRIAACAAAQRKTVLPWCIVVVLVAAGGIYVLMDAIYLHPDPQSAIAVVLTPMLQGIVFLIAAPLAWWSGRRMSA